ncbi:hypothetical protein CO051_02330 [Candidatus Roizmanbacteria bacterium CG_4_9_14_0_2_um_filter_39_13]|uniref:TIGR04255 family protein n=1 Tax=Candidatus Roizmanbacteria bacterium CG_4_9_14_0_2_um_filter_39_13 TaxID=1974839 RepID=A0A2M8F0U6_9BACT|nr:MAG: hypothetical protein CO051_02330 [Candidatus Roizmanbacteria bacterium CG_4_9_14_0_2_um_filter_39_13]
MTDLILDWKINQVQLALFPNSLIIDGKTALKYIGSAYKHIKELEGQQPMQIPLPPEAPLEIPRIMLRSSDSKSSLNIALNRIDYYFDNNGNDKISDLNTLIIKKSTEIEKFLIESNISLLRIGLIYKSEATVSDQTVADYLHYNFLKKERLINPREISIRYIYREKIANLDSNILIFVRPKGSGIDMDANVMLLDIDANVIPELMKEIEETKALDGKLKDFTSDALSRINDRFEKFPSI